VSWRPATGPARSRLGIALGLSGLGVFLAMGAAETPWARTPRGVEIDGRYVGAAGLVSRAELLALAVTIIGAVYLWRSRSTRHLRQAFGLLVLAHLVAALAAVRGHWQVTDVPGLSVAPTYWAAPVGAVIGTGAAAWGAVLLWRDRDASDRAGAVRRARRRWAVIAAALAALAAAAAIAVATVGGGDDGTPVAAEGQSPAAARADYTRIMDPVFATWSRTDGEMSRALEAGDRDAFLGAMRRLLAGDEGARAALLSSAPLAEPPYGRRTAALGRALLRDVELGTAIVDRLAAGGRLTADDGRVLTDAEEAVVAADAALRRSLG
jgi:hypothetical protein